jgi:hypothetical protein
MSSARPFMTRETVVIDTPARLATAFAVGFPSRVKPSASLMGDLRRQCGEDGCPAAARFVGRVTEGGKRARERVEHVHPDLPRTRFRNRLRGT